MWCVDNKNMYIYIYKNKKLVHNHVAILFIKHIKPNSGMNTFMLVGTHTPTEEFI